MVTGSLGLAIFVTAVSDQIREVPRPREDGLDIGTIGRIKSQFEHARIVGDMLGDAEANANDHASYRRTVENITDADIANANLVLVRDLFQDGE